MTERETTIFLPCLLGRRAGVSVMMPGSGGAVEAAALLEEAATVTARVAE